MSSIEGMLMEYMYIQTAMEGKLLRSVLFVTEKGKAITLDAGEEVDEVAEKARDMSLDSLVEGVTGLVKDRLLGCMGQVLYRGLWQGKEPGVG